MPNPQRQTAWISHGLERLVHNKPWMGDPDVEPDARHAHHDFDVVIVGSGYGGAVAAAGLSGLIDARGNALRICVLERGKEYLAGSFPSRASSLAGCVRLATPNAQRQLGIFDGLYDMRWSDDAVAIVACGLGGGSLINAGVLEMPIEQVFAEARWPRAIQQGAGELIDIGTRLRSDRLGAVEVTKTYHGPIELTKTAALRKLAKAKTDQFREATITVSNRDDTPNSAGVRLDKCIRCGDCATGCNHNAKDSLDLNLLRFAERNGAQMVTGATVLRVAPAGPRNGGWLLRLNHTDSHLRDRQPEPFTLRAKRVILAAGTFGSTEILMRSRSKAFQLSEQLGRKFSANGDMLVTVYDTAYTVNAVANETSESRPGEPGGGRDIGPTITAMIDLRTGDARTDVVIQDLAVPGPMRRLFEEATTTYDVLNRLADGDCTPHNGDRRRADDAAVNPQAITNSLVLAMIGRDDANGDLALGHPICDDADGLLTVRWPELRQDPRFAAHHERLGTILLPKSELGGRVVGNLLWRPFSEKLENLFGRQRGPALTVHPLGGCAMGEDVLHGVTDHCGRVFNAGNPKSPTSTHDGLVVLDGSIVPTSLGINPSLTIAALAQRAIENLKKDWRLSPQERPPCEATRRPIFATAAAQANRVPTKIELTEQIRGQILLDTPRPATAHWVEITLTTDPVAIADLIAPVAKNGRRLIISSATNSKPAQGKLRILNKDKEFDQISDDPLEDDVILEADISGKMYLFALETSNPLLRTLRAFCAWFVNRGLRDITQSLIQQRDVSLRLQPPPEDAAPRPNIFRRILRALRTGWNYIVDIWRLCSRAGAVRLVEYDLMIGHITKLQPETAEQKTLDLEHHWFRAALGQTQKRIHGLKRITYGRGSSPWTQSTQLTLDVFPRLSKPTRQIPGMLELNKRYLAHKSVPLLRVVEQEDRVSALTDLLSFGLYTFRILLQVHALTFRKPDPPAARAAQRLPGAVSGLPIPQIDCLTLDANGTPPVQIRLARYDASPRRPERSAAPTRPVLLIHGYSASGTTFVHEAVRGNLTEMLCKDGRDVWVLDMRSSAGLATATQPWAFECMAEHDIPAAIDHVLRGTGSKKLDVVAHCMGSAMFSMAALGDKTPNLHKKIGRAVFSQVGPALILSRANVLAAYIARYVRAFLPVEDYRFSPPQPTSAIGQLLDRALSAMSLPFKEFQRENPFWPPGKATPWVGTRHRMDALYARTFSLNNLSGEVLDKIDDFFGPLNVETVSQVIHFARFNTVTDRTGINRYVSRDRIKNRFTFPLMSIHGADNGLVDATTLTLMRDVLSNSGIPHLNARGGLMDQTARPQCSAEIRRMIESKQSRLGPDKPSYLTWRIASHGHQDCLIGKDAKDICGVIAKYLSMPDPAVASSYAGSASSSSASVSPQGVPSCRKSKP